MHLKIENTKANCRLLWTDGKRSLVAGGTRFFFVDMKFRRLSKSIEVGDAFERLLSRFRLTRQLLRLGIHHLWPLPDGGFLVVVKKRICLASPNGTSKITLRLPRGNKPASKGVCITPEGAIVVGEYARNMDRMLPVALYRSKDAGEHFEKIHEFLAGDVRHIHFVQWDSYAKCLWMGTGDKDAECRLYRSLDDGSTWEHIGGGSQLWRAVGVAFRPDALYWGTDAGCDAGTNPNFIVRFDRATRTLRKIKEVQGPCHGNATLNSGIIVISTGIEGGINEKDTFAHLWVSRDGETWEEVKAFKKDFWPHVIQYGVIRFLHGLDSSDEVMFTCYGLSGAGEKTFRAQIIED